MVRTQINDKIWFDFSLPPGKGQKVTKTLLKELFKNVINQSKKYYEETNDIIFAYREKQLHTVICPSIEKITKSFMIEHPIKRKPVGEEEYSGNIDYWISYNGFSYVIELKHDSFAYARAHSLCFEEG